jgi:hypothetical protein
MVSVASCQTFRRDYGRRVILRGYRSLQGQTWMRVWIFLKHSCHTDTEHQHITGTFFTPQGVNSSTQISRSLISGSTPSDEGAAALNVTVSKVLQLYPDIPAIGSPYGTGNDTFGLSSQYKRDAAIGESIQTTQFWFVPNEDSSGGLAFPVSAANLDEDSQPAQPYNLWIFVYGS